MKIESNVRCDYGSCGDDGKMQPQILEQSSFESLEVKVKPSQWKHQTFLVSYIGNRLLARLAPLISFSLWDLEVSWERPMNSYEMSVITLFTPIYCFRLMDLVPSLSVVFDA